MSFRFLRLLVIAFLILIAFAACVPLYAATPLPPAPATGYCYDGISVAGFNGVRGCPELPPPPPPPLGRITTSNIAYVPATGSIRFTGLTDWSDIWGHASPFDAALPFPGRMNSQPTILNFTRGGYVCVKVHPNALTPSFGLITHTEYNYGADLTAAISNACGNFTPPDARCLVASQSGQPIIRWTTRPATYRTFCPVSVGIDQFLSIKLTNPSQGTSTCAGNQAQCAIGTANSFGG